MARAGECAGVGVPVSAGWGGAVGWAELVGDLAERVGQGMDLAAFPAAPIPVGSMWLHGALQGGSGSPVSPAVGSTPRSPGEQLLVGSTALSRVAVHRRNVGVVGAWVGVNVTSTAGIVTSWRRLTFFHVVRPRSCTAARSPEHA